jgi:hypothetical protein
VEKTVEMGNPIRAKNMNASEESFIRDY